MTWRRGQKTGKLPSSISRTSEPGYFRDSSDQAPPLESLSPFRSPLHVNECSSSCTEVLLKAWGNFQTSCPGNYLRSIMALAGTSPYTDFSTKHRSPLGHARGCSSCCSWSIPHANAILFSCSAAACLVSVQSQCEWRGKKLPDTVSPTPCRARHRRARCGELDELVDESPLEDSVSLQERLSGDWTHHLEFGNSIPPIACIHGHLNVSLESRSIIATERSHLAGIDLDFLYNVLLKAH